jgi:hypothetical protein
LLVALLLAGCSRHDAPRPAAAAPAPRPAAVAQVERSMSTPVPARSLKDQKPLADDLMRAIFGDRYQPARGMAVAEIEGGQQDSDWYALTLVATTTLPDGRTVAIVNGAPSDEQGSDMTAHVSPGLLNVYLLRRDGARWTVLTRREGLEERGTFGSIGTVSWAQLGPGRPGFIVSGGGTWQGSTVSGSSVYDLADGVRSLGGFGDHSDNAGACVPEMDDCWDVSGAAHFVDGGHPGPYWDIRVDFTGKHYTLIQAPEGGQTEHVKTVVKQSASYRFDGNAYKIVAGVEPLPDI